MRDDRPEAQFQDLVLIELDDEEKVRDWCERLACDEVELREAVDAVGARREKVEAYLPAARAAKEKLLAPAVIRGRPVVVPRL
ncbi:MAG TPA: DUF3606 domain-containing protein [Burkholderiaceae bacterium]|nr:DUF3606 domain-containing protein [Burkholderiaceae bacterium]